MDALATLIFKLSPSKSPLYQNTSKGSYRSWIKIVKVWMLMMKEEIFAGHPSLALPPLDLALLALTSLVLALLAHNPLAFALLHSPLPRSPL